MPFHILVVGGTGNVGRLVVKQLLERSVKVKAIVRSPDKLPESTRSNSNLSLVHRTLLDMSEEELAREVEGCDGVVCCLGHVLSLRGVYGPPYRLVTEATKRLIQAIEANRPERPVKYILLNTVGVSHPDGSERPKRSFFERSFIAALRALLPPFADSQASADLVVNEVGTARPHVEWSIVRPDSFIDGDVSQYVAHPSIVSSLFSPGQTTKANIAHFMCELVENEDTWAKWKFKLPVLLNSS